MIESVFREPIDFGIIEPIAPGIWRWPYREMTAAGDSFLVHWENKTIGAIRNHAYNEGARLGMKFSVTTAGEYTKVQRVLAARASVELGDDKVEFEGGDGDKYLGILVPPARGNWSWPFATMEGGQYFHVAHEDRNPERVRALVMVRGGALGLTLSVTANDPEKLGFAKITYLENPRGTFIEDTDEVDYNGITRILQRYAGVDMADLNFIGLATWSMEVTWKREPARKEYIFKDHEGSYRVEFTDTRIKTTWNKPKPVKTSDEEYVKPEPLFGGIIVGHASPPAPNKASVAEQSKRDLMD